MHWIGKAVGGLLGFATAGPVGSALGLLLGQRIDQGYAARGHADEAVAASRELGQTFFEVSFEAMGYIAKIDGRVSEAEIQAARRTMRAMRLTPQKMMEAIERFTVGKRGDYALAQRLAVLKQDSEGRLELARAFVEIQMQAALGSGAIGGGKRQALWRIASELGVGRVEFAQIEAWVRAEQLRDAALGANRSSPIEAAYRSLGVSAEASNGEVKIAYRRLMNQHHPDKLVSRGLPQSMVALAEQRTQEVRGAYERIKADRAFN